jgi:putative transposase
MTEDTQTIERAYRVRAYPQKEQAARARRVAGARRFVWNWAFRRQDEHYQTTKQHLSWIDLSCEFTELKKQPDTTWLAELPREPFNQTLRDLHKAWAAFFKKKAKRPRKKKYGTVQSMRFTLDQRRTQVTYKGRYGYVQLDGVGKVKFKVSEKMVGRLRSVTLSTDRAGRWYLSFTADQVPAPARTCAAQDSVGVDRGIKSLLATSKGHKVPAPERLLKLHRAIRRHQRSYARGRVAAIRALGHDPSKKLPAGVYVKASNRMNRRTARIARLHGRIADLRRQILHQVSHEVTRDYQIICLENLNVAGMAQSLHRGFRRKVYEVGMGELRRQVEYKSAWRGRQAVVIDRFFPSSQLCSTPGCDYRNKDLTLKEREWTCPQCMTLHDRDINAARNIERAGLEQLFPTPRSGESDVRGEGARVIVELPVRPQGRTFRKDSGRKAVSQPTSEKRELGPQDASLGRRLIRQEPKSSERTA